MSKRILWILTIALSLTLLGLVYIQISWVENAISLKDKQFQQLVNSTLTDVSRQLENYYTTRRLNAIISERLSPGTEMDWQVELDGDPPEVIIEESEDATALPPVAEGDGMEEFMELIGDTVIVIRREGNEIVDTISFSELRNMESRKKLEQSMKEQQVMINTIMKKMLLEDVAFEERVEQEQLEDILSGNLVDRGISLDYEYSVIRDNNQEIYASGNFDTSTEHYYFRTALMKNEIQDEETYLYVYFPGQQALVRGSLGFLGTSSLVLTLLMVVLFTFALYVIFRQKKLSDIKNDFVNNMTHELKTPISTISLASQMLSDNSIPDEKKNLGHISRIIQTESKRLGYQVERVLQMAVLDQGHLVLKKAPVSMNEIITTVAQNFRLQIENKQGKLEVIDAAGEDEDMVVGDKVHLMNVVTNLVDNAVKYSREEPEIMVRMRNSSGNYRFSVQDKGFGIAKDDQKKVFDRFYRVSTGNVHDVKGFGLGLSYVKLIVEQHGGTIRLSSELNKGTTFDVTIPLYTEK
ncbi:MAG: HAMP domain-containing sensor histidine kinase [Bacteroidales bacterium]|nr:HAMP domain-containing sensor histidine kinase [Bacteroidales bacterium]MDT8432025.1 HAMP domain-containing sensor histidine kinase [Bacteroidales bacterium]